MVALDFGPYFRDLLKRVQTRSIDAHVCSLGPWGVTHRINQQFPLPDTPPYSNVMLPSISNEINCEIFGALSELPRKI